MNELNEILREIDKRIAKLDERDVSGHIWWYRFRELVENMTDGDDHYADHPDYLQAEDLIHNQGAKFKK